MKYRNDFVTNSSSSSFIIAKKKELTKKQKEAILEYIENESFGNETAETKEELDKFFIKNYREDYSDFTFENQEKYKKYYKFNEYVRALTAIKNGLTVCFGWVSFDCEDNYAPFLQGLWDTIEKAEKDMFVPIDTVLDY